MKSPIPCPRPAAEQSQQFTQFHNYVALPRSEAFRIEYWASEEAKLQRMPAEAEFSRKIALVIGGASGIGREVALLLAQKGAHVVVADFDEAGASEVAAEIGKVLRSEFVAPTRVDLGSSESLADADQIHRFAIWRASTSSSIRRPSILSRARWRTCGA